MLIILQLKKIQSWVTSLSLGLLICKMGIILGPTSWKCCEIKRDNPNEGVSAVPAMTGAPKMLAVITHETFAESNSRTLPPEVHYPVEEKDLYTCMCAHAGQEGGVREDSDA